jgi:uncharacterized membrane protein
MRTGEATITSNVYGNRRNYSRNPNRRSILNLNRESQLQLARALGWFSLALGFAEAAMPREVGQLAGVRNHSRLIRLLGAREIATGIGILRNRRIEPGPVWARVAGDLIDLALLGNASREYRTNQRRRFALLGNASREYRTNQRRLSVATAAVAGVTLLDVMCAQQLSRSASKESSGELDLHKAITVNRPADELYRFWRQLDNLPRFMKHLESVTMTGDKTSHWIATGPAGARVEWDAQIVEDRPGEVISWRSLENADVQTSGEVRFEKRPNGRGTIVRVLMHYRPPTGAVGSAVAKIFGESPESQVGEDLRRFKQFIETGEIPTTRGQPSGRRSTTRSILRSLQNSPTSEGEIR